MIGISGSEMALWTRCPRSWLVAYYYGLVPAAEVPVGNAQLGIRIHTALEGLYGYTADPLKITDLLYRTAIEEHPDYEPELRREWELGKAMVEGYCEWVLNENMDADLKVLDTEGDVLVPLPGVPGVGLRARIDLSVLQVSTGFAYFLDFKGLALGTEIPTPAGWTTIGQVQPGDYVLDAEGCPARVTAKSAVHHRRCYRIRFDDGSSVICDDEHLWETTSGPGNWKKTAVRTTDEIRRTLRLPWKPNPHHHRVRTAGTLDLPEASLPIDPWVLGYWLGDGDKRGGRVTVHIDDLDHVMAAISSAGYHLGAIRRDPRSRVVQVRIRGLTKLLAESGLLGHKHVPQLYLRASAQQRLALLRGLMDSDGTWNAVRHQAVFANCDMDLSGSVRELALSLGQRAVMHTITQHGYGKTVTGYPVTFSPADGCVPFAMPRKAAGLTAPQAGRPMQHRVIIAVDEIDSVPTQCISVDSPSKTYLCTRSMIPTHNTAASFEKHEILELDPQFRTYSLISHLKAGLDWNAPHPPFVPVLGGGMIRTLRRVKRTEKAVPPFYRHDPFRYNADQLTSTLLRCQKIAAEIMEARARLDAGYRDFGGALDVINQIQRYELRPVPILTDCAWRCPLASGLCVSMDDGSDWPSMLQQSGRWKRANPYEHYQRGGIASIKDHLARL